MKLLFGKSRRQEPEIKRQEEEDKVVLFVCVENAGRSQIAEAFFRKYTPTGYMTVSGGTRPAGEINPIVVQAMKEIGIDISKQKSKILTEDMIRNAAVRVNMGCMDKEACPTLFIHDLQEWRIEDPKGKPIEKVREIRDDIEQRVRRLAADLVKSSEQASSDQRKFVAEVIGTFIVVVFATGSVVIDAKLQGVLGVPFIAFAPFVGVTIGVYLFGKVSMAHFNPAVTVGYLITGHIRRIQLVYYFAAEIIGAVLASVFVKYFIGNEAHLGANSYNHSYPILLVFGIEVLASALLMAVILTVVYTRGLKGFSGIVIGGIVGLDIFFLSFISGASMNPARSLAPALVSGAVTELWLYWSATFVGTAIVALALRRKMNEKMKEEDNIKA
jgi:aquaporin Z